MTTQNSRTEFLQQIDRITNGTRNAFERLTRAKNRTLSSEQEIALTTAEVHRQLALEERLAYGDPIRRILNDPLKRAYINALIRKCGIPSSRGLNVPDREIKFLGEDDSSLGTAAAVGESLVQELYDLLALGGAWAQFGVVPTFGKEGKFPVMTARPSAVFIPTEGSTLSEDAAYSGLSVNCKTALCGALISISNEWIQDTRVDLAHQFVEAFELAINFRLDFAVLQGSGVNDSGNGEIEGVFTNSSTPVVTAAAGNTAVEKLDRDDLVNCVAGADAAALQRNARWWVHPSLLPPLLKVSDLGGTPVVQTALEDPSAGTVFTLLGWPITLTSGAPSTNAAASKVMLFGHGRAYGVGLRKDFELMGAPSKEFQKNLTVFRALIRAGGKMRRAAGFSVMKTATV